MPRGAVAAPAHSASPRLRTAAAVLTLVLVTAAAVVGLGLLADAASAVRQSPTPAGTPAAIVVTITMPGTVWDVADRVAPAAAGSERAALVSRIVAANELWSLEVRPGQTLRVPLG